MATNKKIPLQGNLVDLLAAFGRGALGTLTDRFNQYDAALESVATHDTVIEKLTRNKAEWFDAGYITADTCYNIVTGAQPSVTLPLDASELLNRFRAVASRTRLYAGVRFTVQGKEDVCLYLKFAAISPYADSGAVVFEDLQFCYSPTEEGVEDIDVRYKVRTDKSTGGIVLEKVEASAGSQPQEWIIPTLDNGDILGEAFGAGRYEENGFVFDESKVKVGDIVKVTDCAEATLTVIGIHAWEIYTGYKKNVYHLFLSREDKPAIVYKMCLDGQVGYFTELFDASTYAKKTDIPQQPFTFVVNGDNLKIDSRKLDLVVLNGCRLGSEFSVVLPTDIQSKLNGIIGELNAVFSETASSDFSVRTSDITSRMPKFFLRVLGEAMICFQSAQNHSLGAYGYRLSFYATMCDTDVYSSTRWVADYSSIDGRLTFRFINNEAVQDLS